MKFKTVFICQKCGYEAPKWAGKCPECGEWNSLVEEVKQLETKKTATRTRSFTEFSSEVVKLSQSKAVKEPRIETHIGEFDRLLGGGLVKGQLTLLAGAPGIGKSTLMLQVAAELSKNLKVLYISGEESIGQISGRAQRLGVNGDNIFLHCETDIQKIVESVENVNPDVLILDSIQTVYHPEFTSSSGTVAQVRECTSELVRLCKPKGIITFVLGHVTKDGELAGPKILEHMVDCVLYFDTEKDNVLRLLRPHKNRFGSTGEIGLFKMTGAGLESVENASEYFAQTSRDRALKGRAYSLALEGSRPILTEVQALVSPTRYPFPRRVATGVDLNRCLMLFAALEKHIGLPLDNKDIFVSLAGGVKLKDPALDLAICAAVISSCKEIALPHDSVFMAEVGILGQAAKVPLLEKRLEEAQRLGFKKAYAAAVTSAEKQKLKKLSLLELQDLSDLALKLR
ncbi:MAG: DNA repair protein RadA [Elusimicrobium sp.]|uniref:DNA repair protein RadA n=1 Tax=Candidatus Avelusimicrobium gallicola TaxID=2562704 RepID=A0A928DP90_9BACT|nr:DNA repair protein RadA [Elusimicrobium sp.]